MFVRNAGIAAARVDLFGARIPFPVGKGKVIGRW